jgi:hypothetical protein
VRKGVDLILFRNAIMGIKTQGLFCEILPDNVEVKIKNQPCNQGW